MHIRAQARARARTMFVTHTYPRTLKNKRFASQNNRQNVQGNRQKAKRSKDFFSNPKSASTVRFSRPSKIYKKIKKISKNSVQTLDNFSQIKYYIYINFSAIKK